MEEVIALLAAVRSTMNTISVVGIDNQDKLVGCYSAIGKAVKQLKEAEEKEDE